MREMVKLFVVVVLFSMFSGGLLAAVRGGTQEKIEYQQLKFVKGPVLQSVFKEASNDPLTDRFKVKDGKEEVTCFPGILNGKKAVAIEGFGKGYGGDIGVIVAINVENGQIMGVGVTTHSETPGLGSRAKEDPSFTAQFNGLPVEGDPFKVKGDGGKIDALSGATVTSRGVCGAVNSAVETYQRLKPSIMEKLKAKA